MSRDTTLLHVAPNEDSAQHAYPNRLISLRYQPEDTWNACLPIICPEKTIQTVRMRRLILVFAGRTSNPVGNAYPRLIC